MKNHGIELPMPKERRPVKGSTDGALDVQSAVDFMESATKKVFELSQELEIFAANAKAMVEGPLTLQAVAVLIQAGGGLPRTAGGRPLPVETIIGVLEAAARLGEKFLKPQAPR